MSFFIEIPKNINSCVYKVWYGDKYIIEKCKTLEISVSKLVNGLNCFIKNTPHGRDQNNLAYNFFNYVLWNEGKQLSLELVYIDSNPYKLLKKEQEELDKGKVDPNCLNKSFDAYIPQYTQVNGQKSWINRGYYLNFCIWKKRRFINHKKTE